MSRSGYSDDCDGWHLIMYRGRVASAIKGKRGQKLLTEMLAALDAMPEKVLVKGELEKEGSYCALGVVGSARGMNLHSIDPEDAEQVSKEFDIATAMAREIVYENDEGGWWDETPEKRWERVRNWVDSNIKKVTP